MMVVLMLIDTVCSFFFGWEVFAFVVVVTAAIVSFLLLLLLFFSIGVFFLI